MRTNKYAVFMLNALSFLLCLIILLCMYCTDNNPAEQGEETNGLSELPQHRPYSIGDGYVYVSYPLELNDDTKKFDTLTSISTMTVVRAIQLRNKDVLELVTKSVSQVRDFTGSTNNIIVLQSGYTQYLEDVDSALNCVAFVISPSVMSKIHPGIGLKKLYVADRFFKLENLVLSSEGHLDDTSDLYYYESPYLYYPFNANETMKWKTDTVANIFSSYSFKQKKITTILGVFNAIELITTSIDTISNDTTYSYEYLCDNIGYVAHGRFNSQNNNAEKKSSHNELITRVSGLTEPLDPMPYFVEYKKKGSSGISVGNH